MPMHLQPAEQASRGFAARPNWLGLKSTPKMLIQLQVQVGIVTEAHRKYQ